MYESGRPGPAVERLRRALSLEPRFAIARMWLAEALRALGKKAEAKKVLAETLKAKKTTPWAHYLLARFAHDEKKPALAEKELSMALLLDGKYPDAYLLMSQIRLERGNYKGALVAAQQCVDIAANLGRAYISRAAAYEALGRAP